jgi:hypothetical protein
MSNEVVAILNIISLLIGTAMVLWGLKIFKFYIILLGICLGAALGLVVGGLITQSPEGTIIGCVISAIIGGVIAWPLQKLLVFLAVGALGGMLCAVAMIAAGLPPQACLVAGIVVFIICGIVAVLIYEYIIIILMAMNGAQSVFNVCFMRRFHYDTDPEEMLRILVETYSNNILFLLFIIVVFVGFALFFQKKCVVKKDDNIARRSNVIFTHRLAYVFALIAIIGFGVSWLWSQIGSGTIFFGINIISWPIVVLITAWFGKWFVICSTRIEIASKSRLIRFIFIMLFSLTIIPLISWLIDCIYSGRLVPIYYYQIILEGGILYVAAKCIYSFIILPALIYILEPRNVAISNKST